MTWRVTAPTESVVVPKCTFLSEQTCRERLPPLTKPFFLSLPSPPDWFLHVCPSDQLHREWRQRLFCSSLRWGAAGHCAPVITPPPPMSVYVWSFRMSLWSHVTGAVGDILKIVLCLGIGEDKNDISWLTGYLIWSFVDYFCVSIVKLNKTGGFHDKFFFLFF